MLIIFSRRNPLGLLGKPTILGNPQMVWTNFYSLEDRGEKNPATQLVSKNPSATSNLRLSEAGFVDESLGGEDHPRGGILGLWGRTPLEMAYYKWLINGGWS